MAKIKSFTDAFGASHVDAVWFPNEVHIAHADRRANVVFAGWHNAAALAAGKSPLPGADHAYPVSANAYLSLAGTSEASLLTAATAVPVPADAAVDAMTEAEARAALKALGAALRANTLLNIIATAAYAELVPTLDTVNPADPTGPKVSFFDGCADVTLPV